jgi:GT2 family glycosyltransferase
MPEDSPTKTSVAVLMTCHNRRETTLRCLGSLFSQLLPENIELRVYLVDDGSTDGTAEAIQQKYPSVVRIRGDGVLYWCGGMRLAWSEAMKGDHDYFLWLNDDTVLLEQALACLIETSERMRGLDLCGGIIVGSVKDPSSGRLTYGGRFKSGSLVEPRDHPQPCDTMNGNIVLVSAEAAKKLGNISQCFTQKIGDWDYGLRAREAGIPVWIAPGYQGFGKRNALEKYILPSAPFKERWRFLHDPKGMPPSEYLIFLRRHYGFRWIYYLSKLYLTVCFPGLRRLKKDRPIDS